MPQATGAYTTLPAAWPAVLRALDRRQRWGPCWELPLLEHEDGSTMPSPAPLLSLGSHSSLSAGEDGSKSPGPKVHDAHPGPSASTGPRPPFQPTARSTHCSQPRLCLPGPPGGSGGNTPHETLQSGPGVLPPRLKRGGPWVPHSVLRSSEGPPQQGPGEALRLRER